MKSSERRIKLAEMISPHASSDPVQTHRQEYIYRSKQRPDLLIDSKYTDLEISIWKFEMIKNTVVPITLDQKRLIILGKMRSLYCLAQTSRRGDTLIEVRGSKAFLGKVLLGKGSTRETIPHEVGQPALELMDIVDPTNFMHFDTGPTDYRLRYCSKKGRYVSGNENQRETIPGPALERNT